MLALKKKSEKVPNACIKNSPTNPNRQKPQKSNPNIFHVKILQFLTFCGSAINAIFIAICTYTNKMLS
jgi:hypothetical protein